MEQRFPSKRKGDFSTTTPRKTPKMDSQAKAGKMSFAERMMAKMGHVEGQGLGKQGEGIINPIEVKLRPQGAGVGAVKEKTEQYKQEQRRAAEARGEEYEDSSEEERKARRKRRERARTASGTGAAAGVGGQRRKIKYRTVEEVEAAAPGLALPRTMLSSIVDATGSQTKLLTSATGLMSGGMVKAETEEEKIKKRERLELEAFIDAWHGLQERKTHLDAHEGQLQLELTQMEEDVAKLKSVLADLAALEISATDTSSGNPTTWIDAIQRIEALQTARRHEIESCKLDEAAVAILAPQFKKKVEVWEPLEQPTHLVEDLLKIRPILGISTQDEIAPDGGIDPHLRRYRKTKATTPYETLMYRTWLPHVRTSITAWDVHEYQPLIDLVQAWRPLLPPFIYSNLAEQLIIPKLTAALRSWNPRKRDAIAPHIWLFPWLPQLPSHHLDASSSTSLLSEVKRALRQALSRWDLTLPPLPGLSQWSTLLDLPNMLTNHLLPRLATHLSTTLIIDPSEQQLDPITQVLQWNPFLPAKTFARLLHAELFPKLLSTLHLWLTSPSVDLEEIAPWLQWWKTSVLPDPILATTDVRADFQALDDMYLSAVEVIEAGGDLTTDLAPPKAGPSRPIVAAAAKDTAGKKNKKGKDGGGVPGGRTESGAAVRGRRGRGREEETTFRDVVDAWCADNELLLVPMREAHGRTGNALLRITGNWEGRGGVVGFVGGDVLWVRVKGEAEKYVPVELGDELVERARGKG